MEQFPSPFVNSLLERARAKGHKNCEEQQLQETNWLFGSNRERLRMRAERIGNFYEEGVKKMLPSFRALPTSFKEAFLVRSSAE